MVTTSLIGAYNGHVGGQFAFHVGDIATNCTSCSTQFADVLSAVVYKALMALKLYATHLRLSNTVTYSGKVSLISKEDRILILSNTECWCQVIMLESSNSVRVVY